MLPIDRMDLISLAHKEGQVYSVKYYNKSIYLRAALPATLSGKFYKVQINWLLYKNECMVILGI